MDLLECLYEQLPQVGTVIGWLLIFYAASQFVFTSANDYLSGSFWIANKLRPGDWLIAGLLCLIYSRMPKH